MRIRFFLDFARLCEALENTTKRNEKKKLISDFLLKVEEASSFPRPYEAF